jgi:Peptidase family M23
MTSLFALQLTVPLIFIGWMALAPPRSLVGFWIQLLGTAAGLLTIGLTGLWLLPPWWAPYAFGALLLMAMVLGLHRRRPFNARLPSSAWGWAGAVLFVALGGVALYQAAPALAGRTPPSAKLVNLTFPLDKGTYLVVNGGYDLSINAHMMTLDLSVPRFAAWRGQSYGVDIVKINAAGLRASGILPPEPRAYLIYGTRVLAPCSGDAVSIVDGLPDMQVPQTDRANMAGNHVLLRCGDADVLLGHLQPGSVKVKTGNHVAVGDAIGAVGNSGNTGEPHLHIHAQQTGTTLEPISGTPLPINFSGRVLVRNDRVSVP